MLGRTTTATVRLSELCSEGMRSEEEAAGVFFGKGALFESFLIGCIGILIV